MKRQRYKDIAAVFLIVFLLPYVLTVLISGVPKKTGIVKTTQETVCVALEGRRETLTLPEYLSGVVAAQMPADYEMEALKAQAVLAGTYYELHNKKQTVIGQEGNAPAYLGKAQMKELWKEDYERNYRKIVQAVTDTQGQCMYIGKKMAEPYFHAVSAGTTRDGEVLLGEKFKYLKSAACEEDLTADGYVTIKNFSGEDLEEAFTRLDEQVSGCSVQTPDDWKNPQKLLEVTKRDAQGYVCRIKVHGQNVPGEIFRQILGLPSANFEIEKWEDGLRFVCRGLGHGLGMSLNQANVLAKQGKTYEEILKYFFDSVEIKNKSS